MPRIECMDLYNIIARAENKRKAAEEHSRHLQSELDESERGRMRLWGIIRIMAASADQANQQKRNQK